MQKVIGFLQEVKGTFKQISWPKKDSLIQLTFVVISISIITSLILGGFDYLFTQGMGLLGQSVQAPPSTSTEQPVITLAPSPIITQAPLPKN